MQQRSKLISILFICLFVLTIAGFYKTYFGHLLTQPAKLSTIINVHAVCLTLWLLLFILQPILIWKKKYDLHEKIGRISYFLAPLIVYTIYGVSRGVFQKIPNIHEIPISNLAHAVLGLFFLNFLFVVFYIVAMVNRKSIEIHIAFIIAATLQLFLEGWERLIQIAFKIQTIQTIVIFGFPFLILTFCMVYGKLKYKKPILKSPYLLLIIIFGLTDFIFMESPFYKTSLSSTLAQFILTKFFRI